MGQKWFVFPVLVLVCLGFGFLWACDNDRAETIAETSHGFTNADYSSHLKELKKKIPGTGVTIVLQKPFYVVGDGDPAAIQHIAVNVVAWAVKRLKYMYFSKDPEHIIDIWLFDGEQSYKKHTWQIFRDRPDTPFGYSSPRHMALVMNIRTGTGTLVHEIVHPFMRANFPTCPPWFNEGLASLYEQCTSRGNLIFGLTNWRLAGLQQAIRKNTLPTFNTLMALNEEQFYNKDPGTNYAQSRYLCYYLQEKGKLTEFYNQFRKNKKQDPTGWQTLKKILKTTDMTAFKKQWQQFVLTLSF